MSNNEFRPRVPRRSARHPVRGLDYAVSEWGVAGDPPLVLLHGWGDAGTTFQFFVDELRLGRHIIAPDWRGFGESRYRAAAYWFPDYLADLDALLQIYSPDRPVDLLGHSMGGNVAGLYAGVFPERVRRLVNVEGFGLRERDPADAPANFRRWIEEGRDPVGYRHYSSFDGLSERIIARSPRMSAALADFVARAWAETDGDGRICLKADPAHKLPNAVLYRRAEAEACWGQVSAPVLLVVGAESDFRQSAKAWLDTDTAGSGFPAAETAIIENCGHMVHFEQPAALARAVEGFLEGERNDSGSGDL